MAISKKQMTAEELERLPDDGRLYELVNGELRIMTPAGSQHGRVGTRIYRPLANYVYEHGLGEVFPSDTGFQLTRDPDTVRSPDVAFVCRERMEAVGDLTGYWPGAPDLVVEVISPSDLYTEVEDKILTWLGHGTRLVLVANPRHRTISVRC